MDARNEATQHAISMLDGRIAETRATHAYFLSTTRGLEGRLRSLERQRNSLKNQIAKVSFLPDELLSMIFEHGCLPSPSLQTGPPIEIVLSHVNQRFRDVAVNTRLLWARIEVLFRTPLDKVVTYLQRSRTCPFDFHLDIDVDDGSDSDSELVLDALLYTTAEWETIMSHMTHCRHFSVRCSDSDLADGIINHLHMIKAPLLQSIRFECSNGEFGFEPSRGAYRKIVEGGAPVLTTVRIVGLGLTECLPPLTTVTSLTLQRANWWIKWSDLRAILTGCLALTHFVIEDILFDNIPDNFESSIVLTSLQSLHILLDENNDDPHVDRILLAISAPVLDSLFISSVIDQDLVDVSQIHNSDRFPRLRYLSVSPLPGEEISQESWTLFLSVFPHITHFTLLSDGRATNALIMALRYSPSESASSTEPVLMPELHTLSFDHLSAHAAHSICDLVPIWIAVGRPLKLLELSMSILNDDALDKSVNHLRGLIEVKELQSDGDEAGAIWNQS
jgi:hypothetical protein